MLLTQGHVDHVSGVDHFRDPGTVVVAQANNPTCPADDARIHRFRVKRSMPEWADAIRQADEFIAASRPRRRFPRRARPTVTFDLGPGDLTVHHARTLHTAGDNRSASTRRRAVSVRYCGDDAGDHLRPGMPGEAAPRTPARSRSPRPTRVPGRLGDGRIRGRGPLGSAVVEREFEGMVALVTGAAGAGIGQATARRLAAGGATIVVTDVHARRTEAVTAAIRADHDAAVFGYPLDVADRDGVDTVVADVTARVGPIRILVNNAAVNVLGSIFDYDPADWDRCVAVNLTGPWYLCRATMPGMRDAGGGAIVNVSSVASDIGGEGGEAPYAVTKGGLNTLTRSCAHEGGPHGIRVNAVAMGVVVGTKFVDTHPELIASSLARTPLGELATADDIAEAIAFLASDRARHVTGETLNVSSGSYMRT